MAKERSGSVADDLGRNFTCFGRNITIEEHLEMPVYLELFVKVRPNWRESKQYLKSFGYKIKFIM